jgi:hypothetical protein
MPWARLPLYLFVEDWHRYFSLLFCELGALTSSPDPWAAAHYAIGNYAFCSRKHHLWRCVKYEHAHCWKRFVLRSPDSEVLVPIYSPIAVQGLGAGAITSSVYIMLSDLVTLRERGTFSGLMALYASLSLFLETS